MLGCPAPSGKALGIILSQRLCLCRAIGGVHGFGRAAGSGGCLQAAGRKQRARWAGLALRAPASNVFAPGGRSVRAGGGLHDSHVVKGMVLKRDVEGTIKSVSDARVAVFAQGVDTTATETKAGAAWFGVRAGVARRGQGSGGERRSWAAAAGPHGVCSS